MNERTKTCPQCQASFTPLEDWMKYCSYQCRKAAHPSYRTKKEIAEKPERERAR